MNDNLVNDITNFDKENRLNRRIATINEYYQTIVTNIPFNEYFGNKGLFSLTEFVAPDEKNKLMDFIDSYNGKEIKSIFRFKDPSNNLRLNLLILMQESPNSIRHEINIEMIDIESLYDVNNLLFDDIKRYHAMLGLTGEFTFTYNINTDIFCMYRYDQYTKETIYKMSLTEWKKIMISEGFILDSDIDMFNNLIGLIRAYDQSFSVKLTSNMRTNKQFMEKLVFTGLVYTRYNSDKIVIGRILSEENAHNNNAVIELINELSYDSLTHVYNKRSITEYIKGLIKTYNKDLDEKPEMIYTSGLALVIIDIDNFKRVNDIYGHMYGDKVLTRIGRKLKEILGDNGSIGRIGGDEFIAIIYNISDSNFLRGILRAIRTQLKWEFINDFTDFVVTVSIGASQYPKDGKDYDTLFRKADYCLYTAKEKGRDRYVFYREELHSEGYMESLNKSEINLAKGRDIKELKFITNIINSYAINKRKAIKELLEHIKDTFKVDSINIYKATDSKLKHVYNIGVILDNSNDAGYVHTNNFKNLLENNKYVVVNFVATLNDYAPEFCEAMKERQIISTIQIIIGDKNNINGLLTIDKIGHEPSKWAEYEIETCLIAASLMESL